MPAAVSTKTDLSLSEMLHVLDVARTLRRDTEIVESELNKEELIASLKERLMASAAAAGDDVTEAEVDAAIRIYFENLHRYTDPPLSVSVVLAHTYVRRRWIAIGLTFCAVVVGSLWWLFWREGAPLSSATQARVAAEQSDQQLNAVAETFRKQLTFARSIAEDAAATAALDRLEKEGAAAVTNRDEEALQRVTAELTTVESRLREAYEVIIVSRPGERSAVERGIGDSQSSYYLIVEARTANGDLLPRTITSREDGKVRTVKQWGEQVPEAVYRRIGADKQADGVVDEQPFAIKRRGRLDKEVVLPGVDGRPLMRQGQITDW